MDSSQRVRAIVSFIHAVDAGSLSAAARVLGVSAAAVSKNVAGLEAALGVRLLNRTTRTLTLTEEGKAFLQQARIALDALDTAVDTIAARRATPSGRVRISTSSAFGQDHLLPALPKLMDRYPGLSVEIDFDDRVTDIVRDGYDIAIRGGSIPDSALVTRPVFSINTVLVASGTYLQKHGIPRAPQELHAHRLIARRFLGGSIAPWNFKAADGGIVMLDTVERSVLTLSAPEAVVQSACNHQGIAHVGVHLAWKHLLSGALKVVLHDHHHPGSYEMVMQYPHRALLAPRVKVTIDHLLEVFEGDTLLHVPLRDVQAFAVC